MVAKCLDDNIREFEQRRWRRQREWQESNLFSDFEGELVWIDSIAEFRKQSVCVCFLMDCFKSEERRRPKFCSHRPHLHGSGQIFEWTRTFTDPLFVYSTEPKELCKFLNGDVSGKLPTYPSPKPTSTLTSHLGENVALGEG